MITVIITQHLRFRRFSHGYMVPQLNWIEHLTSNQKVGRSSRSGTAILTFVYQAKNKLIHILVAFTFLIFSHSSVSAEMTDLSRYNSLITNTLVEDGADCEIESFYLSVTTKINSVFLVECSKSSYLNEVEITCVLSPNEKCEVTRY